MESAPIKVLIADEEPDVAVIMGKTLRFYGEFEVYTVCTDEDAFKIMEEKRPELCIIELYKGGCGPVDGVKILRKIKESNLGAESLMMVCRDAPTNEIGRAETWGAYGIGERFEVSKVFQRLIPEMVKYVLKKRQSAENPSQHIQEEKMENSIKVLVVDDEDGLADYMQRILALKGYTSFMETDGIYALNFFKSERPDIVLIDVDLGNSEINGVELLRRIKEINKDTVCIMVTRITAEDSVAKAKEYGALHYLLKPLDTNDVVTAVNEAAALIQKRRAV
jgi:DNA-binding NtrC family response regulator